MKISNSTEELYVFYFFYTNKLSSNFDPRAFRIILVKNSSTLRIIYKCHLNLAITVNQNILNFLGKQHYYPTSLIYALCLMYCIHQTNTQIESKPFNYRSQFFEYANRTIGNFESILNAKIIIPQNRTKRKFMYRGMWRFVTIY